MSAIYGSAAPGEFLPGITIPPEIHGLLRKRVTEIQVSGTVAVCMIAQARAESLVEAMEVLKAIPSPAIEQLYLMIENSTQARLTEIVSQQ